MPESKSNMEVANIWIGLIFAKLYESFPMPHDFNLAEMVEGTGENPAIGEPAEFGIHLLNWLRDEGYIRGQDGALDMECLMDFVVLTERGLHVLNAVPHELTSKRKVGEQLMEASKDLGKEGAKKIVGELVGQVIGGIKGATA